MVKTFCVTIYSVLHTLLEKNPHTFSSPKVCWARKSQKQHHQSWWHSIYGLLIPLLLLYCL